MRNLGGEMAGGRRHRRYPVLASRYRGIRMHGGLEARGHIEEVTMHLFMIWRRTGSRRRL